MEAGIACTSNGTRLWCSSPWPGSIWGAWPLTRCWEFPTLGLYVYNMERHPKKQIREACDDANVAGFKVSPTTAHGHSWGYIDCPNCAGRFYVWSTPASADVHAKQIRRFVQRHSHSEERQDDHD